jgi:hypothetical protein
MLSVVLKDAMKRALVLYASLGLLQAADPTYSKDIAPIFYQRCVSCHHPNDIAPMSLMTYRDARPWAKSIRDAVITKKMPPWYADPHYGTFENNPGLSKGEIDKITAWVDQGVKEGDSKDLPPAPVFTDGWRIGKPDLIVSLPEEQTISANAADDYKILVSTAEFKEDVWVKAVELRPGNRKVVHHAHAYLILPTAPAAASPLLAKYTYRDEHESALHMRPDAPVVDDACRELGQAGLPDLKPHGDSVVLTTFVPGRAPEIYPDGYARLIPAGSKIAFQIHYARGIGTVEKDRTSVGLILAKGPPKTVLRRLDLDNYLFRIPSGASNHEITFCYDFPEDVRLVSLTPHMHLRGKDMKWELMRPDAVKETLLFVPHYDFNWQIEYKFMQPVSAPKGSRLIVTAHFDNSANNRVNPDPTKTVRWGEPTSDEMAGTWVTYELP